MKKQIQQGGRRGLEQRDLSQQLCIPRFTGALVQGPVPAQMCRLTSCQGSGASPPFSPFPSQMPGPPRPVVTLRPPAATREMVCGVHICNPHTRATRVGAARGLMGSVHLHCALPPARLPASPHPLSLLQQGKTRPSGRGKEAAWPLPKLPQPG